MDTSPELLEIEGLQKVFQAGNTTKTVLHNINVNLAYQDSLAIVGPSGCGKTTLLLLVAGLVPSTAGAIRLNGETIAGPSRKIALVLQHYGLFPWKTVAANILLGSQLQKIAVSEEEFAEVKRGLRIEDLDHLYPQQLSGGQRQRVALARAILLKPSLLLLDEPFAAIDTITRERLQNGLISVFNERRFSFVIVTHSIEEALVLGRRIIVLGNGTEGIRMVLPNPGAASLEYRSTPEYFAQTLKLRQILEDME